ncbi:MAG: putative tail length phage protein [bacterium]|nr:MAG: putative tail length phage protein [bacterium]KAF0147933.1 MAG: putative tail length phage protein [bacterium]KAF0168115.1 MAG: putative tail length phage protein [bacterium]TXT22574.1 MAG: putative tail length phage protein [bacterium]
MASVENTKVILDADDRTRAAFESARRSLDRLNIAGSKVSDLLSGLGVGALAGGGLLAFAKSGIDAADALSDMSQRLGVSVETLAGYKLVADRAGVSTEELAKGARFLAKNIAEGDPLLARIGVTSRDVNGALVQLADVFAAMPDGAEKTALAMRLLGKSGADLIPALNEGGDGLERLIEQGQKLYPVTAEMANAAARFNDSLGDLKIAGEGLSVVVGNALLPALNGLADLLNTGITEGVDQMLADLGRLGPVGQTIGVSWANVAYVFDQVGDSMGNVAAKYEAFYTGNFRSALAIEKMGKESALRRREEHDALIKQIMAPIQGPAAFTSIGGNKYGGDATTLDMIRSQETAIRQLSRATAEGLSGILTDEQAGKLQDSLRKAFDLSPMDDYQRAFTSKRRALAAEYDALEADLSRGKPGEASGVLDLSGELMAGRAALNSGNAAAAGLAADRAKEMLLALNESGVIGPEGSYWSRSLRDFELAIVSAEEKTAEATANSLARTLDQAKLEIAAMDPVAVPLAAEAMANEMRNVIKQVRDELASNPLVVPVQASWGNGASAGAIDDYIRQASLKRGAR